MTDGAPDRCRGTSAGSWAGTGGDATEGCQEAFEPLMAVVDGLDVQVAADPLAGRLVQRLMADADVGGAPR